MPKTYFHNYKLTKKNKKKNASPHTQYSIKTKIVDINKLLNRVKIEKKNENKRKLIFYSSTILSLSLFGALMLAVG